MRSGKIKKRKMKSVDKFFINSVKHSLKENKNSEKKSRLDR